MSKKRYSISFTTEEFLTLYKIVLQIDEDIYKTDNDLFKAECLFSHKEKEKFQALRDKVLNFREKRLMPARGGKI